jgi:hypothetical protein
VDRQGTRTTAVSRRLKQPLLRYANFPSVLPAGNDPAFVPQAPRSAGIGKVWASMIQHLLVTSIQGGCELHADNMFSFGANLTEFILSRCAPVQATPAQQTVGESFRHVNDDVLPLRTSVSAARPEYFVRTINDHGALDYGIASELPAMLGPHPPEDVMHLGSWIQLYTILNAGGKPARFECLPHYNGRPPELVCERTYPLLNIDPQISGTICLSPNGRTGAFQFVVSRIEDTGLRECEVHPLMAIQGWFAFVSQAKFMVAPLVFRRHALFRNQDDRAGAPFVAINFATPLAPEAASAELYPRHDNAGGVLQFLSHAGNYVLSQGRGRNSTVHFTEAHERLVPLGAFVLIRASAVTHFGIGCLKFW